MTRGSRDQDRVAGAQHLPLFTQPVSAGFPSPAQDYLESRLDLNRLCIRQPAATFFVRVEGESMLEAGIHDGDMLVVDRSLDACHGDIVVACVDGEFTVKELALRPRVRLLPRNPAFAALEFADGQSLDLVGVVTCCLRFFRKPG
ncbi:MAG: translesion error-prone DNA polymerase V autoproteolytic subunit [Alcanivorax sp.]|nr:translesion error-prone DNA polymerase V autoproteolytic subunit [Alcanivorax sp.]